MSPVFCLGHYSDLEALRNKKTDPFPFSSFSFCYLFFFLVCVHGFFLFVCGFFERQRIGNVTGTLLSIVAYQCSCY